MPPTKFLTMDQATNIFNNVSVALATNDTPEVKMRALAAAAFSPIEVSASASYRSNGTLSSVPLDDRDDNASAHPNEYSTQANSRDGSRDPVSMIAKTCSKSNKKVNFDQVTEQSYYMEPGDANQVLANGKFGFCKGDTPVKLGRELAEVKIYPCPEESNHGQPMSKIRLDKDQRMLIYKGMSHDMLIEHIHDLAEQNKILIADKQHLMGKNHMLHTRIMSSKDVFRKTDGKLAEELSEELAAARVKIQDLECNNQLMNDKLQASYRECSRLSKELQIMSGVETITPSARRKRKSSSRPPKPVETYSLRKKKRES